MELPDGHLDGILGVLVETVLLYGGSKVKWAEVVQYVIDGRYVWGVGVEQGLLFWGDDLGGVVDASGCEGSRFDGVSRAIGA